MDDMQEITRVANAELMGQRITIERRLNGALEGCPECFSIRICGEGGDIYPTRAEAKAIVIKGKKLGMSHFTAKP